jgi:hypothetical protein
MANDPNFEKIQESFLALDEKRREDLLKQAANVSSPDPLAFAFHLLTAEEVGQARLWASLGGRLELANLRRLSEVCWDRLKRLAPIVHLEQPASVLVPARAPVVRPDNVGYMSNYLIQATLPRKLRTGMETTFSRGTKEFTLTVSSRRGLPSGWIPRYLLVWFTTRAFLGNSREIYLGKSPTEFVRENLKLPFGGGHEVDRVRDQVVRLAATTFSIDQHSPIFQGSNLDITDMESMPISNKTQLWVPVERGGRGKFPASLTLSDDFFKNLVKEPPPLDMDILLALRSSPLAMDIYAWVNWTNFKIRRGKRDFRVKWVDLMNEFAPEYTVKRLRHFRAAWRKNLAKVLKLIPYQAVVADDPAYFVVIPSPLSVPQDRKKGPVITLQPYPSRV